jgi:hypothetical protein
LIIKENYAIQGAMVYPIVSLMTSALLLAFQYFYRTLIHLKISFCLDIEDQSLVERFELGQGFFGPAFNG